MDELILNEAQIDKVLDDLAEKLNRDYGDSKDPIYGICVLKGAAFFTHDLVKKLKFPFIIDYIQVSSYAGTSSTGVIHLKKDIDVNLKGKKVLILEDIVDTGRTLKYLKDFINKTHEPEELKIVCFIDKKPLRKVELEADYVGMVLNENKFLVGYGFDYNELLRNIPYVFTPTIKDLEERDEITNK